MQAALCGHRVGCVVRAVVIFHEFYGGDVSSEHGVLHALAEQRSRWRNRTVPGFHDSSIVEEGIDEVATGSTCHTGAVKAARLLKKLNCVIQSR